MHKNEAKYLIRENEITLFKNDASESKIIAQNGKTLTDHSYSSDKGTIIIKQEYAQLNKGEAVFLNGIKAPKDKYRINFMCYLVIDKGVIKDITLF